MSKDHQINIIEIINKDFKKSSGKILKQQYGGERYKCLLEGEK